MRKKEEIGIMRSKNKIVFCLLGGLLLATSVAYARGKDVEGSKDHPLVSRFAGSVIMYYDVKQFDEYTLPLGKALWENWEDPVKLTKSKRLEGKITRIFYEAPKGRSPLEIYRSYEAALKRAGFEILFSGAGEDELGSYFLDFIHPKDTHIGVFNTNPGSQRYLAAKLSRREGDVYVSLYTFLDTLQYGPAAVRENWPAITLVVVEVKPMEEELVKVDADALAKDIAKTGRVAVYGIYFDIGKADLKPESEPAFKEIAKLLRQNPKLKLYVVGHTHSIGDFTSNMKLSRDRADAVVKELVSKYGVDAKRLRAHGVGPLAPVASNETEEGRAKNRRVELVKQ